MAASLVQQPALFGVAVCQLPLTDTLRYQLFGLGRSWQAEFGNAEGSEGELNWLLAYSPVHNVGAASYPATLVTVALHVERTHPLARL